MRAFTGAAGRPAPAVVFLLGSSLGILAESALVLTAHTRAVEAWLRDDLRVIVFMKDEVTPARRAVAEEKLRSIEGVAAVRSVPAEESLGEFAAGDPDLARSAAFLGSNPLPDAVEIRLSEEGLRRLPSWLREAEAIPEAGDIVYKPLEVQAVMQVQLYRRLLTLALALACCLWFFALAARIGAGAVAEGLWAPGAYGGAFFAGLGTAFGIGAVLLLAYPVQQRGWVSAWPPLWTQGAVLAAGAAAGWMLYPAAGRRRHAERQPPVEGGAPGAGALLLAAALLAGMPARAAARDAHPKQRELKKIQEQIERKREEAQKYQQLQQQVERDISALLDRKQKSQRVLLGLKDRREEALRHASELSEKLGALRSAHGSGRLLLSEQNRAYALALAWGEPFYGTSELWQQALRRAGMRARLRMLGGLKSAENRAAAQNERARSEVRSLETKTTRAAAEVQEHETLYQQKRRSSARRARRSRKRCARSASWRNRPELWRPCLETSPERGRKDASGCRLRPSPGTRCRGPRRGAWSACLERRACRSSIFGQSTTASASPRSRARRSGRSPAAGSSSRDRSDPTATS